MPKISLRHLLWFLLAALVSGTSIVVLHLDSPFGFRFWSGVYLLFTGISGLLFTLALLLLRQHLFWKKAVGVLPLSAAIGILILLAIIKIDYRVLIRGGLPKTPTAAQWRDDISFLDRQLRTRHPAPFTSIQEEAYAEIVQDIQHRLPELSENQILVEIMRMVALLNDGHTSLMPFPGSNLHLLPLKTYWFDDGLYIVDAADQYRETIGFKVVEIEGMPIDAVFERFKSIIGEKNSLHQKYRFQMLMLVAELLQGLGISSTADRFEITLQAANGKLLSKFFYPEPSYTWAYWYLFDTVDNPSPAIPNFRDHNYSLQYLKDSRTLCLQINAIQNQSPNFTFRDFVRQADDFIAQQNIEKIVIDLRNCLGGNAMLVEPLVKLLADNAKLNTKGRLFTLIGRKTYSAAANLATMLEGRTATFFVGEPSGQGDNHFGDHMPITLPNSKLTAMISSRRSQFSLPFEHRTFIEPDLKTRYTFEDFREGRDTALAAVLNHKLAEQRMPAASKNLAALMGDYVTSPYQVLRIMPDGDATKLVVTNSFHEAPLLESRIYVGASGLFDTDIKDVHLESRADEKEPLLLHWHGETIALVRAANSRKMPLDLLHAGEIEAAAKVLLDAASHAVLPTNIELSINSIGYALLSSHRGDEAVAVFKLNVQLFPKSANTYDSLGEALLAGGDHEAAYRNYKMAAELNPHNRHAKETAQMLAADIKAR